MKNIFENIPEEIREEVFDKIIAQGNMLIERIVSRGQSTPPGDWLEQEMNEWVILIEGEAELSFEDTGYKARMGRGDHLFIAAGRRHRVEWTHPEERTIWLAVHYQGPGSR